MTARIGVNALYLIPGGVGGTEIYLRELLGALAAIDSVNEYLVFTNRETGADLVPRQANFLWKPQAVHASLRPARILWEQTALPFEAARYRLDVMLNPGFTAPLLAPCPCVTTFHDMQHKIHPEYFRWFDLPFWKFLLWASAHRSQRIVAVSEVTKASVLRFYKLPPERIVVAPHGVHPEFFRIARSRQADPPGNRSLLYPSTLHPHKNHERLIRAFARCPRGGKLILAGMRGFHGEVVEKLIAQLGLESVVELTGWLSRENLLHLYESSYAFIYPSTFEGFGMPVLEALATGIPVACADIPPLREVAGDAALFFDPLNEDAISAAIDRILTDDELRRRLAIEGPLRAAPFTWKRVAATTLGALLSAAGKPAAQPLPNA